MSREVIDGTEEFHAIASTVELYGIDIPIKQPTVIVAGAAVGIGMALTKCLMKMGFYVIALDKLKVPPDWFLKEEGKGFFIFNLDCSDVKEVDSIMDASFEGGRLAQVEAPLHLVATLGLNRLRWFKDGPHTSFKEILESNLLAPMVLASSFAKGINRSGPLSNTDWRRTITFYSSIAGEIPMRTTAPYCSAKAGLNMLIRCLSREFAPNIEVYGITLGPVGSSSCSTQMDDVVEQIAALRNKTLEEVWEETARDIPVGELIPIGEIMRLQNRILSGNNFSIFDSGTNFRLTGGRS